MPMYEVSGRSTLVTATAAAALVALRAVTRPCRIWEIHLFYVTAPTTNGSLGLCRSTAIGTGTLTSVTPVARSVTTGIAAATALLNTAWATLAPTNGGIGTVFRRVSTAATIGNGVIWTFDREPLEVAGSAGATSELCVVNTQAVAPGTFDVTFVYEE
jgi:hypothetical protein